MTATIAEARDQMNKLVRDAWIAAGRTDANIRYDDSTASNPANDQTWIRITVRHNNGRQANLAGEGKRRWARTGTLFVQLFTPINDGLKDADVATKVLQDAIEGKTTSGGVWFRNVRVNENGKREKQYNVTVLADFTYEEMK